MIKGGTAGDVGAVEATYAAPITVPATADMAAERLGRMVREHFALVFRTLRRLGVPEGDADDAAQQVFLVAQRRIDSIAEGRERAFLLATAVRIASRMHRSRSRRKEVDASVLEERTDPSPGPDELVEKRRARELLDEILGGMTTEQRIVFALYEIEQLTMAEIAEALRIPQGTVASRLRRAREHVMSAVRRIEGEGARRSER